MVNGKLVIEKGEQYESKVTELDKARREYDDTYSLAEMIDDEETFKANAVELSPQLQSQSADPKDKPRFAILSFHNDELEQTLKVFVNFPFESKTPIISKNKSTLFHLIGAILKDKDSNYFKINYELLREAVADITDIEIVGKTVEDGDYELHTFEVDTIDMKE